MNIEVTEEKIELFKKEYKNTLNQKLEELKGNVSKDKANEIKKAIHDKGVDFFNFFEKSLDIYNSDDPLITEDYKNKKYEDVLNIIDTIIKHWQVIRTIDEKFGLVKTVPSRNAYGAIQRSINKNATRRERKEICKKFKENKLYTDVLDSGKKHTNMTKKHLIAYGVIAGTLFLVALLIIVLVVECPTPAQERIFLVILALAAAAFAATIPGFITVEIKHPIAVSAGGALAVFVIVFFSKPAQISTFTDCERSIAGTVYFGDTPQEGVELNFVKLNQNTNTNQSGNFHLAVDFRAIGDELTMRLTHKEIALDTSMTFTAEQLKNRLEIKVARYCVGCTQRDSVTNALLNEKSKCYASKDRIGRYIEGFTAAGRKKGRIVKCQVK